MDSLFLDLSSRDQVSVSVQSALFLVVIVRWSMSCLLGGNPVGYKSERENLIPEGDSEGVRRGSSGKIFISSVACCFYLLMLQIIVLIWEGARCGDYSALLLPLIQAFAWMFLFFSALNCKYRLLEKFPFIARLWWFASLILSLYSAFVDTRALIDRSMVINSLVILNFGSIPALLFLSFIAYSGFTGITSPAIDSGLRQPLLSDEDEAGCLTVTPYSNAGLLGLATLSWLSPLLAIGNQRPLELKDIPLLAPKDRSKASYKALNHNWEKLKSDNVAPQQPSLTWALVRTFWKEASVNAIFAGLNTLVSYVGPFLISYFVDFLGGKIIFPHEGYILAGVFFSAKLIETLTTRQWYLGVDILGMHVRSALTAMLYRKGLRLSSTARQSHTSGEIVNYMAVDVQRVGDYSWYLHDIWMLPLQIVLALGILYKNVGIAFLATLISTIISIVVTIPLAKIQEEYQDKLMTAKDERMRKTAECLKNMRILKLQAWEDRYRLKLEEMRNTEFKWLRKALYSQAVITFIFWGSPIFVSVITFGTSILLGDQLTAGGVLSALATFRILQEPLRNFPDLVSMIAQTKVSVDRISGFLLEEELREDATVSVPRASTDIAVEIKDGEFRWDPLSSKPTLSGLELRVGKGMRVAICGVVGSGKSSFLSCILGEIPKISGEVS